MPSADDDDPEVRVVGGAAGRPRRRASDVASIRSRSRATSTPATERETSGHDRGTDRGEDPAPGSKPGGDRSDRRGGDRVERRSFNILVAVVALLAVTTVLFGVLWGTGWGRDQGPRKVTLVAGSQPVKQMSNVARTFVQSFTNFDPESIDGVYNRINGLASGDFQKEWPTLLPPQTRDQIRANRAQLRGEVKDLFVQNFTGTSGEVYAVADVTYANKNRPQPTPDTLRFDINLVKVDGDWKINQVDLLNSPGAAADLATSPPAGGSSPPASTPSPPG